MLALLWLVLAVACITYGIIVRSAGSGTGFFMVWMGMGMMFIILAIAVRLEIWRQIPGILRKMIIVLLGVCIGCFLIVEGCIVSGFNDEGDKQLDYIIVLGAQVYKSGPSKVLKFRLDKACEYLEENPETICIVSGGQGYNEPFPEAVGMADYLKKMGISGNRIIMEKESETTEQNISNSRKLMKEDATVGIVTNNFHVFRAVWTAQKQGLENACGIAAGATKLYLPNNMLREFFGVVKLWIFMR